MDLWHLLTGRPLKGSQAKREEISAPEGLAALSLDALTSVAYGPEAIVVVLATAGTAALPLMVPITIAIVVLLAILVLSYIQVIEAYPNGGGAYAVSRENLGVGWSQIAAAALIVDYTLTVAVSIAAGVAALTSAFPSLVPWTVPLDLGVLSLITVLNLRGVAESARAFLLPTAVFVLGILTIIAIGWIAPAHAVAAPHALPALAGVIGVVLVLKAFAAGCSALTGVEAIANGVPLFREPRKRHAKQTEIMLGVLLGVMLLGLALLATHDGVGPQPNQTVLSQVMAAAVGRGFIYYTVSLATTVALALAANTSYGGLPVLTSLLARDDYLPHIFAIRGDRLVFQYGIWVLTILAAVLLIAARGNTDALVPLFAIGVFIGFTLSQAGLVLHWWRTRPRGWVARAVINAVGSMATGIATAVFLFAKFLEGAWIVALAIPLGVLLFRSVFRYYRRVAGILSLGASPPAKPQRPRTMVVVPVANLDRLTVRALGYALAFGDEVVAVHVAFIGESAGDLDAEWERWNPGIRLVTLRSQYRSIIRPLLRFIRSVREHSQDPIVVLIPEIGPQHWWQNLLHNQMGLMLAASLRAQADVVVSLLPFRLDP